MVLLYSILKPSTQAIRTFLSKQSKLPFSYTQIGATRELPKNIPNTLPLHYVIDSKRICLGRGKNTFACARTALNKWEMFNLPWVQLYWPSTPQNSGYTVAVLARVFGIWSLNAARITYNLNEPGRIERYGFAYGTLPGHAESGEERFTIEWNHDDDSVWYEITSFSRPNQLISKLAYPITRTVQQKFVDDSLRTMAAICAN